MRSGRYWLFLDEIQYVENWAQKLKIIHDNYPNISVAISGSASAELRRGKESLAGRETRIDVPPLLFPEYLEIKHIEPVSEEARWNHYLGYMKRQLPALAMSDLDPQEYVKGIVDKAIDHDIPLLLKAEETDTLRTIFRIVCKSPGEIVKAEGLASELGISRLTATKYLHALEESLLIRRAYNYSRNPRKSEKRAKKAYPYYTTLHEYIRPYVPDLPGIAETEVAFQTGAEYFWNERGVRLISSSAIGWTLGLR
jgi:hypothetical protein